MNKSTGLWEVINRIDDKYLVEAMEYKPKKTPYRKRILIGSVIAAACLAFLVLRFYQSTKDPIEVYATEIGQKLTGTETIISTGKITDTGGVKGGTASFFIQGSGIEKKRFSCKNYWIHGLDSTEKRESYGNSKNFTFDYGDNKEEYSCLLIVWEPTELYFSLKDHDKGVAELTEEEREDIIVMQIMFLDGKEATMAMWIHIDTEGYISARVGKYKITSNDVFVLQDDISSPHRTSQWWEDHYIADGGKDYSSEWGITVDNPLYSKFTEEQLANIMKTLQEYFANRKSNIQSVTRYRGNRGSVGWYEGYDWNEVIYFRVMIEDDTGAPIYIAIGSKDGWNKCQVLNAGY